MIDLLRGRKGSNKFIVKTPLQYSGVRFEHGENSHCAINTNHGMNISGSGGIMSKSNKSIQIYSNQSNQLKLVNNIRENIPKLGIPTIIIMYHHY